MINHVLRTEQKRLEIVLHENRSLESAFRDQVEKEGAIVYQNGVSFRTVGCEISSPFSDARFVCLCCRIQLECTNIVGKTLTCPFPAGTLKSRATVSSTLVLAGLGEEEIMPYLDVLATSRFATSKAAMGLVMVQDLTEMGINEEDAKRIYAAVSLRRCAKCDKVLEGGVKVEDPGLCSECGIYTVVKVVSSDLLPRRLLMKETDAYNGTNQIVYEPPAVVSLNEKLNGDVSHSSSVSSLPKQPPSSAQSPPIMAVKLPATSSPPPPVSSNSRIETNTVAPI